jgi:hypothetical protein
LVLEVFFGSAMPCASSPPRRSIFQSLFSLLIGMTSFSLIDCTLSEA